MKIEHDNYSFIEEMRRISRDNAPISKETRDLIRQAANNGKYSISIKNLSEDELISLKKEHFMISRASLSNTNDYVIEW